jgi:hypothetical protein
MTNETLLAKLADWHNTGPGRHTRTHLDESTGWGLTLTADRFDELSCLVWELSLRRSSPRPADADALAAWAARIADRVSTLAEPVVVHEVDPSRNEALLRSKEPSRRNDQLFYHELLLRGINQVSVRRYQGSPAGAKREQVAFPLTHEALAKLVQDLTG